MTRSLVIVVAMFWIGTGIAIITSVQAMIIAALGHRRRLFLTFAVVCVSAAGLLGTTALYYAAHSADAAGDAMKWHMAFALLAVPFVYLYVGLYTGDTRPPAFRALAVASSVLLVMNMRLPYGLRFSSIRMIAPGEFAMVVSAWSFPARILILVTVASGMRRCWLQFRSGDKRAAVFLGSYLVSLLAAFGWSNLLDYGLVRGYYLGGWSFLIIMVLMSVKVGMDLRDRDRAIRRAANDWKDTFDSLRIPILLTDTHGFVLRANRAACDLAGVPAMSRLGLGEPWNTARTLVARIGDCDAGSSETVDEKGRTWELTISRFSSAHGETRCILALWEMTSVVELQESLRKRERISAIGAMLAGVAHEVRNPLFGISATLDAYDGELETASLREFGGTLRGEVQRLSQLMKELLDFGKPAVLQIESCGLAAAVNEAVARFVTRGVNIRTEIPETLPALVIDRARLRQVFENLIENATQHSAPGSMVHIVAEPIEYGGRCWIECRVDDSGTGFIPDDVDRIFEPFYSRREGGTGLGLSIVQRIVQDHAGYVSASNRVGGGASVRLRLPIACD